MLWAQTRLFIHVWRDTRRHVVNGWYFQCLHIDGATPRQRPNFKTLVYKLRRFQEDSERDIGMN